MSVQANKDLITRYNKEVIGEGNMDLLQSIASPDFINHSAPEGMDAGLGGMIYFFSNMLHPAFPDLKVEVLDMIAEGDKVTTRKKITGTHAGELVGIQPTNRPILFTVIDILAVKDGKITEHWGENNFASVIESIS